MLWLIPLITAAITWSVAEIFSDVCIDDGESDESAAPLTTPSTTAISSGTKSIGAMQARRGGKLSGDQATLISAFTMLPCVVLGHMAYPEGIWNPDQASWYFPVVSGVFFAIATFSLYKAYETAPSTVVVPLVQLTAVMMLVTSTFVAFIAPFFPSLASEQGAFISFSDAISYLIIVVGGLYPATKGNLQVFSEWAFWKQPYVVFILLNDLLMSWTYELLQISTSSQYKMSNEAFVIISSYTMLVVLFVSYMIIPHFRREFIGIFYAKKHYIVLCVLSEMFNYGAYWIATYAYQVHQVNVSVVNAAEMALNQIMNLVAALVLQRLIRFGREKAIEDLNTKVLSCILVTFGIILATMTSAAPPGGHGEGSPIAGTNISEIVIASPNAIDLPRRQGIVDLNNARFDRPLKPFRMRNLCNDKRKEKKLGPEAYEVFRKKCLHMTRNMNQGLRDLEHEIQEEFGLPMDPAPHHRSANQTHDRLRGMKRSSVPQPNGKGFGKALRPTLDPLPPRAP